jgi:hypothetical protein
MLRLTVRIEEARPAGEADREIDAPNLGIEVDRADFPGRVQAQSDRK